MTGIAIILLLALVCAGTFGCAWLCLRLLKAIERLEGALLSLTRLGSASEGRSSAQDSEQARYEQGVANILAYGTREMTRRRGEAQ